MIIKPDTGIDISRYQRAIKIANLAPLPRFVIIKATESTNYRDSTTVDFAHQVRDLKLPLGFYHFWRNVNGRQQADIFLDQVKFAGGFGRIPPVLDLEIDLTGQARNVKIWLDRVETASGKRPILYGRKDIFAKLGNPAWFKNYDIWTASYPTNPDWWSWIPLFYRVKTGRREIMWQYASTYRYPAYPYTRIDTNIAKPEWLAEIS